jgi:hypothetical protein
VEALEVYDDGTGRALYVGGTFDHAGGVTARRIARWDGETWTALSGPAGNGIAGSVRTLAVYHGPGGPELVAGGSFFSAGGVNAFHVAKWDGTAWSPLSGPTTPGMGAPVWALEVHEDGRGPKLFAGGDFVFAGGVPAEYVASWDGTAWSSVRGPDELGMNAPVLALTTRAEGGVPTLYAGGAFGMAGGLASHRLARRVCDYSIFVDGFESGDVAVWSGSTSP